MTYYSDGLNCAPPSVKYGRVHRFAPETRSVTRSFAILIFPGFPMMAFSSVIEPLRAANKLSGEEGAQLNVALKFQHLSDFEPEQVVKQVEPLRKLLDARQRLTELKSKLDGNDKLEELLTKVLNNPAELGQLKDAMGVTTGDDKSEESK